MNEITIPPELNLAMQQAIGDGLIEGVKAFIKKNRLPTDPGTNHTNAPGEFTVRFTAEMSDLLEEGVYKRAYPFKNSFKKIWVEVLTEMVPKIVEAWNNKEDKQAIAVARTIAYLETIKFLEENRQEVVAEYHRIRGNDLEENLGY